MRRRWWTRASISRAKRRGSPRSRKKSTVSFARWVAHQYGADLERGWVKGFQEAGRPGAYLRVLRNGSIRAGDSIEILSRPEGAPTIAEVYRDGEVAREIRA